MQPAIRERLEGCSSLPSLPAVAIRILDLCQQERLDLNEIAAVISNDPALATKLIKTANSPIFALRREVTSISYAVSLLGVNAVRTLVLSFSLSKECSTGNRPGLQEYWRRSVLSALAARQLCVGPRLGSRDEAFLCGLIQDIGMLALSRAMGPKYTAILEEAARDHDRLITLERTEFGCDHADVGAWLMERWRAPRLLAEVVAASHAPEQIAAEGREDVKFLASVVALSGRFADLWAGDPSQAPACLARAVSEGWPAGAVDIDAVNASLVEEAPLLAPLFEVKLDAGEMSAVVEQAQEVMLALSVRTSQELNGIHETLARLESRTATLLVEAQRDPLTGIANRGYTNSYLEEVFKAALDSSRLLGVIYADVDHFKRVNDDHGHAAGDAILQSVAQCISRAVRGGDFVGRFGGEEFVIVLRADNQGELMSVAERIRRAIGDTPHSIGNSRSLTVTISLGCALLDTARHQSAADLLAAADRALYAAKHAGRNQAVVSQAA